MKQIICDFFYNPSKDYVSKLEKALKSSRMILEAEEKFDGDWGHPILLYMENGIIKSDTNFATSMVDKFETQIERNIEYLASLPALSTVMVTYDHGRARIFIEKGYDIVGLSNEQIEFLKDKGLNPKVLEPC